MKYRALKNFNIGRTYVAQGEIYGGSGIEELLRLKLVEAVEGQVEEAAVSPSVAPQPEPALEEAPKPKKRKAKAS